MGRIIIKFGIESYPDFTWDINKSHSEFLRSLWLMFHIEIECYGVAVAGTGVNVG